MPVLPVPSFAATEADFREAVSRMASGAPPDNVRPAFDPKQAAEFREEAKHGRKEGAYVQALESHGFRFWNDLELARAFGAPTGEGLWRHPVVRYRLAFRPSDLPGMFETPEAFDRWVRAHKLGIDLANRAPREEVRKLVTALR